MYPAFADSENICVEKASNRCHGVKDQRGNASVSQNEGGRFRKSFNQPVGRSATI